jgi:opacity protein-like surface antigen
MRRLLSSIVLSSLVSLAAAPAEAQRLEDYDYEHLELTGFGFEYGRIWPTKVEVTNAYTVRVDLGYLGPGVRVTPSLSYWTSTLRRAEIERLVESLNALPGGGVFQVEDFGVIHWSDLSLMMDVQGVWRTPLGFNPFAGFGLGLHALNGRGDAIEGTFVEDLLDTVTFGGAVSGGLEVTPLPRLRIYTEGRYTLVSNIQFGGVAVGVTLLLGR